MLMPNSNLPWVAFTKPAYDADEARNIPHSPVANLGLASPLRPP